MFLELGKYVSAYMEEVLYFHKAFKKQAHCCIKEIENLNILLSYAYLNNPPFLTLVNFKRIIIVDLKKVTMNCKLSYQPRKQWFYWLMGTPNY